MQILNSLVNIYVLSISSSQLFSSLHVKKCTARNTILFYVEHSTLKTLNNPSEEVSHNLTEDLKYTTFTQKVRCTAKSPKTFKRLMSN